MHFTRNSIPLESRIRTVEILNNLLASALDLYLRAKNAHWNAKGPTFMPLHELFDQVAAYASGKADVIAERIEALGGTSDGSAQAAHLRSSLPATPPERATTPAEFLTRLADEVGAFTNSARARIEEVTALGDQATADVLIEAAREGDHQLFFLEAHLS